MPEEIENRKALRKFYGKEGSVTHFGWKKANFLPNTLLSTYTCVERRGFYGGNHKDLSEHKRTLRQVGESR